MLRDTYGDYFWKLPQRFHYAVFEGENHLLPTSAELVVYKFATKKDKAYYQLVKDFIYRQLQDDMKIIALAGPVGIGKTHLMCASANFIRCYQNRTFLDWSAVSWDLLKKLNLSVSDFVTLLLEFGYLFIDDIKFMNNAQIEVFQSLILKLYNSNTHSGVIFTQNWDPESGPVKDLWYNLVSEYIVDRLFNMTQFIEMKGSSRRKEVS